MDATRKVRIIKFFSPFLRRGMKLILLILFSIFTISPFTYASNNALFVQIGKSLRAINSACAPYLGKLVDPFLSVDSSLRSDTPRGSYQDWRNEVSQIPRGEFAIFRGTSDYYLIVYKGELYQFDRSKKLEEAGHDFPWEVRRIDLNSEAFQVVFHYFRLAEKRISLTDLRL